MKTHFFLARHGETQWNKSQKLQGQLDSPLTELGLIQAAKIADGLTEQSIELIACSPLGRALRTAKTCQEKLPFPIIKYDQLKERHFGEWQGKLIKEVENHQDYQPIFFQVTANCPPNGETAIACAQRFQQALIDIANQYQQQNILIVSHGDIMRCFLSFIRLNKIEDQENQYNNGCLIAISFDHQTEKFSFLVKTKQPHPSYA